jgi:Cupin
MADISKGETHTYTIAENAARTVKTVLTPGKMTIFPQGAIHTMMNVGKSKPSTHQPLVHTHGSPISIP